MLDASEQLDIALCLLERAAQQLQDSIDDDRNDPLAMEIYAFLERIDQEEQDLIASDNGE